MKKHRNFKIIVLLFITVFAEVLSGCTKVQNGFLSPFVQYAVNEFTITRGRIATSYSLITDGSSIPMKVKWTHIYDSSGTIVDTIFKTKYPVAVWNAAYNSATDKDYASITAKRTIVDLPPLDVNATNGTIEANAGTIYLPIGTYTMDLEVSNSAGTQQLKNIMKIHIVDGKSIEITPETGAFSSSLLIAGTASGGGTLYNGNNNPFVDFTVTRIADTPNDFTLYVTDKNGVPFNPKTGEFTKRPNSGLNPNPPFLQNLQDYAPDTYVTTDNSISIKYPLTPFPIASLGNGYNMYYRIPAQYVHIDSTKSWSGNTPGYFYQGTSDPHYLGAYVDGAYDYALRIPMRIQVPGSYELRIKLLNATHR
ncbi:MAG: hypothetical protein ABI472_18875 [Ginsengibacter sp.]